MLVKCLTCSMLMESSRAMFLTRKPTTPTSVRQIGHRGRVEGRTRRVRVL